VCRPRLALCCRAPRMLLLPLLAVAGSGGVEAASSPAHPNIVWFLTDDQDQMLGGSFPQLNGVGPMPKTQKLMVDEGTMATNFFIHTPICCPSRSEVSKPSGPLSRFVYSHWFGGHFGTFDPRC
jgi:hypothetical protein